MEKCMKVLLCFLICLSMFPVLAEEQDLPVIQISFPVEEELSQVADVEANVKIAQFGQESSSNVLLRLSEENLDIVESLLPQKSLSVDGDDMRFDLYNGGNDGRYTMVISAVCANLIENGPIDLPLRTQEHVEVYLNGEYWGIYTRREDIVDAIVRFEGLDDRSMLNVTNVNHDTICGDPSSIADVYKRIKSLELSSNEDQQILDELLDTESFLNWLAVNCYLGTGNLFGEIVYYQIGNGPWKCAMGDSAYALMTASANPFASLYDDRSQPHDAAILARAMLEQPVYRDAFLTKMGALYQTFTTELMQEIVDAENARITAALPAHMNRWAGEFYQVLADDFAYPAMNAQESLLYQQYRVYRLRDKTLVRRPWYVYDLVQRELNISDEDMVRYFGGSKPELPEVNGDAWEEYKATHMN